MQTHTLADSLESEQDQMQQSTGCVHEDRNGSQVTERDLMASSVGADMLPQLLYKRTQLLLNTDVHIQHTMRWLLVYLNLIISLIIILYK